MTTLAPAARQCHEMPYEAGGSELGQVARARAHMLFSQWKKR